MRKPLAVSLGIIWLAAVLFGFSILLRHSNTPTAPGNAPSIWPQNLALRHSPHKMTLVMLAHPHCPCTRASLRELEKTLTRIGDRLETFVLMIRPHGLPIGWEQTALWRQAEQIPGVTVVTDDQGKMANLLGGGSSGHVLLYNQLRQLRFSGGITGSRAHEGDNTAEDILISSVLGKEKNIYRGKVFGCELFAHNTLAQKENGIHAAR